MAIIAVAGRKGGVGKSTIVGNLAAEFAAMGRSVIVLDADPQHSLAAWAAQGDGMLSRCVEKVKGSDAEALRSNARSAEKAADVVLIDTPPGMPETTYQAALVADLFLLPCGPSPLDLFSLKQALSLALKARGERRSKRPRIRSRSFQGADEHEPGAWSLFSLKEMGKKVLPPIGQRIVVAEAVTSGLTVCEYAPNSVSRMEFKELAKAVHKIVMK